ncbi:MAG: hypothetical protein FD123_3765 [Bacteroidetes bacterium]|nr:MAG: hypothetical protein FD123_3765 [Bacteroidota bacterium]
MTNIAKNLADIRSRIFPGVTLVAISKTKPVETILEAYDAGQRVFGENKVQELEAKYEQLPKDIQWHLVGHLQSNKVKYIAPFVSLIHSVDSLKLLQEINKQAQKNNRVIDVLLQIFIAQEETKFGLSFEEADTLLGSDEFKNMNHIRVRGLMGMASNTENMQQVRSEFASLKKKFDQLKSSRTDFDILSMGMSGDYAIAIEEGSTMIRVGSSIFGER